MKTGERIKTIRKSQGITQAKLAETLHISSSFMSRIENGSSSLTLDFVCEIADALQVTRQEVLRDVFTYTKDDSILISKKIEINIQKFSPEKQSRDSGCIRISCLASFLIITCILFFTSFWT